LPWLCRWDKKGNFCRFLLGSPEDEEERSDDVGCDGQQVKIQGKGKDLTPAQADGCQQQDHFSSDRFAAPSSYSLYAARRSRGRSAGSAEEQRRLLR
jgi:hypothetical protein